ncbi:fibronectin type-III domain-containing protein 3A-like isoform X2 [Anopheles arabiensis]|uniref:Fibronectin type-III domain-containing protein n=1 Tax=Anopheles arabiensis TaxID=7173 RepID=A0A8W7MU69_ANOAR|nr:fibronectin type-III domain-containing protein 3A-like isoform X2 [Anopheles arabiensis]XP_040169388.1 fibronectin type-III domain-containing protein 3A-like isoform X2 [Anopheles arabiensis]XP_040169389.1 fibronectin type-III domain-containing protein 3A-like isoform X2 [Anopheles arabiensis]XP_040169390.1 fibronectin type-III domain-containing protein 3A-like isoform X2 [Anopheles arabiensis]
MVRRAVSTSPESTNHHHLNSHHHLSQAQTPTSSTSSLSSASDGQPVSQQPSPSSQQHSPVSVSSAPAASVASGGTNATGGHGGGGGGGYDVLQFVRQLPGPLGPGQQHVHLAPHGAENGGHGGLAGAAGGIFIAAGPYAGDYYSDHSYYYPHPDYGSPPPGPHPCPVHHEYGPVTLPMVSQNGTPPMAMPMQVPQGHIMQQIVDENGTLRHVILSTQPPQPLRQGNVQHHLHPSAFINGTPTPFFNPIAASYQAGPGAGAPQMYPSQLIGANGANVGGGTGGNHGLHTAQGNVPHSPSPPHTNTSYHKDERAQRQHSKLHRKLDQKQRELNASATTPINSPRKHAELNGGGGVRKSHAPPQQQQHHLLPNHMNNHRNGTGAAVAINTPSPSEEDTSSAPDEEDDNTQSLIVEHLSAVPSPQVTEITPRTALLQWSPPTPTVPVVPLPPPPVTAGPVPGVPPPPLPGAALEPLPFNVQDLRYEVLLSDHGKENKYKSIFKGSSLSCKVQDLRPGQEYTVRLQVYLDQLHGSPTEPTVFNTPCCEPDVPAPPKLLARSKNSLQLRWNAPSDNGSHIIHYILECDNGKGSMAHQQQGQQGQQPMQLAYEFFEVCKTKGKQFQLNKLQPSTYYVFRLSAVNEYGRSGYSDLVKYSTVGNAPAQPAPPTLRHATATTLKLAWQRRSPCEEYTLQMNDDQGYGYRNVYNGQDTLYECIGLRRASTFQFRLRAENDNGRGPWSEEVVFRTLPTCPGRPAKPQVKGKVHANGFRVRWDAPHDTGGADISLYHLEISSGASYDRVYSGKEAEATIDRLNPGTAYQIRVLCEGPGGISAFSEPCLVTTEPVSPGPPQKPYCKSPPTPYAACLGWEKPDYNGGSPVLEYEMEVETVSTKVRSAVYRGRDMFCVAKDLLPGEQYTVQVRALNRIGAGPWSEEFTFTAGSAPPESPRDLSVVLKSPTHLTVMWAEPHSNGSPISEYILQSSAESSSSEVVDASGGAVDANANYQTVYRGAHRSADVRNLHPHSRYHFRVCALNAAGCSRYSVPIGQQMPAAAPNAPTVGGQKITAKSILISWQTPHDNGSPVTQYNIECGDRLITTDAHTASAAAIAATSPEQQQHGAGGYPAADHHHHHHHHYDEEYEEEEEDEEEEASVGSAASTDAEDEPSAATNLVDSKLGKAVASPAHSAKGGKGQNHAAASAPTTTPASTAGRSSCSNMLLIGELHPETTYKLRIQAVNAIGTGPFSSYIKFTTSPLPPKPPKLECAQAGFAHLKLRWGEGKNLADLARYYVEMENRRTGEYHNVYTGTRNTCKVMRLHETTSYTFRICVETRHAGRGEFSDGFSFTTAMAAPNSIKAPRVCTDAAALAAAAAGNDPAARHGTLTIEWQTSRNNPFVDPIEYILQMAKARDQEFQQAYRGPETRFTVHNLQHGVTYAFKVCPVRVRQNGELMSGPFSPVLTHHLATNVPRSSSGAGRSGAAGHATDDVDGRTPFQGNVVNSKGELVLTTKSSTGAGLLLAGSNNGYGPDGDGHQNGARSDTVASTTLQQLQKFFEPDSSKAVVCVFALFLLSIIVAAFLK